jgi:mannose-6-phosphate isomerase-like protein (cupin superfamily)
MRFAALSLLALGGIVPCLSAQTLVSSVTVEPRPEEYVLWDAEAIAAERAELAGRIESGRGLFGTGFAYDNVLGPASHRPHYMSIVHRVGYTQPEIHELKWDMYFFLEGSGTMLIGCVRTGWIDDGRPTSEQHPMLEGAQEFPVTEGDIIHVPARVWHQLELAEGQSMTYAIVNIMERAPQ